MQILDDWPSLLGVLLRFAHIVFGIVWLGHLAFLNLVNVPLQAELGADEKRLLNPRLLLRVFYWFRTASMYTFMFGWLLFGWKYFHQGLFFEGASRVVSNRGLWMLVGVTLATIMWFNVWFIVWPLQKQLLTALGAGAPHPDAARLGATSTKVSRLNLLLSGPMLFAMIVPNNFPGWSLLGLLVVAPLGAGFWLLLLRQARARV